MGKILCIAGQKGGIGRSTFNQNIAAVLGEVPGRRILLVDTDGQAGLTLINGLKAIEPQNTISQIFTVEGFDIRECIVATPVKGVDLIPSDEYTYSIGQYLYQRASREFILNDALAKIKEFYDYILIDISSSLNIMTLNALVASQYILLLYTASRLSLEGLSLLLDTYTHIKEHRRLDINKLQIVGAVQNRFKSLPGDINQRLKEALENIENIPRFFSPISESIVIEQAQFNHKSVIEFNPRHQMAEEFRRLTEEIIAHV